MKKINLILLCLFLLLGQISSHELTGSDVNTGFPFGITSVSGSPAYAITVAGGNGNGSDPNQLSYPSDMFVDATGAIYVADRENNRIQKWAYGAFPVTVAGGNGPGRAASQLSYPSDVFVDAKGNIYVADQNNNRIQKWAPGASRGRTVAGGNGQGSAANQLSYPSEVFVDATGNIYVADQYNDRIQKWAPGAIEGVTVAGGNGRGAAANQLSIPEGVFVDAAGNIYISDRFNYRIQKWVPGALEGITVAGGNGVGSAANQLSDPYGISVDASGNIFMADNDNHRIQKWTPGAIEGITVAGGNGPGSSATQLTNPAGVFVDASGNIYVADQSRHRIQKFETPATGSPLSGITVAGSNGEGSAPDQLAGPIDVFVDQAGNIYVADTRNNRIQKWAPGASAGVTVAGGNGQGSATNQITPTGIFVDAAGNIYVADPPALRVQMWVPGASAGITVAGGKGLGPAANQLSLPTDVHVDAAGNVYVADQANHRIQKWVPGASAGITVAGGNGAGSAANQLDFPYGIFADETGNVYVADPRNNRIQKWAPGASAGITVAGGNGPGPTANKLDGPHAIFVDATGNVYIGDTYNHRIQKWASGALKGVTVAGGNGQGPAANQLDYPYGTFVDTEGNIYVADGGNHRIQKFGVSNVDPVSCLPNIQVAASSCTEKATISWNAPTDSFPTGIKIPEALDPDKGKLTFMGAIDGHGYYRSTGKLLWQSARDISRSIGANGHLATITSDEETNLIFNQIRNSGYSPWIGLSRIGQQGRFRWVNIEPLVYTNWAPGEPNNSGGTDRNITEPYVRMIDTSGAWNDQPDDYLPFIVEFERPLIRNRQIAGPRNGSAQKPGVYTVCYERRDFTTDKRDTCCFTITVTCNPALIPQSTGMASDNTPAAEKTSKGLQVTTSPNPSSLAFRLNITSDNSEKISLQVTDVSGRIVETRNGITPNQPQVIGSGYRPGIYFAQVMQGNKIATVRLIKQSN